MSRMREPSWHRSLHTGARTFVASGGRTVGVAEGSEDPWLLWPRLSPGVAFVVGCR
jgi:hypothetical protein